MGLRSLIRDLLIFYMVYENFRKIFYGKEFSVFYLPSLILLLIFTIWFILEKVGLIPKKF